jgi:hypothetical protein
MEPGKGMEVGAAVYRRVRRGGHKEMTPVGTKEVRMSYVESGGIRLTAGQ